MALLLLLAMPMVVNIGIILNFRRMLTNRKAISFLFYELLVAAAVVVDTVIGEITLAHVVVAFVSSRYISLCRSNTKSSRKSSSCSSVSPL